MTARQLQFTPQGIVIYKPDGGSETFTKMNTELLVEILEDGSEIIRYPLT